MSPPNAHIKLASQTINVEQLAASGRFVVKRDAQGRIRTLRSKPEDFIKEQKPGRPPVIGTFTRTLIEVDPGRRVQRTTFGIVGRSNSPIREPREMRRQVFTDSGIIESESIRRPVGGDTKEVERAVFSPSGDRTVTRQVDFGPRGRQVTQLKGNVLETKDVTKTRFRPFQKSKVDPDTAKFVGLSATGTPIFRDKEGDRIATFTAPNLGAFQKAERALRQRRSKEVFGRLDDIRAAFEREGMSTTVPEPKQEKQDMTGFDTGFTFERERKITRTPGGFVEGRISQGIRFTGPALIREVSVGPENVGFFGRTVRMPNVVGEAPKTNITKRIVLGAKTRAVRVGAQLAAPIKPTAIKLVSNQSAIAQTLFPTVRLEKSLSAAETKITSTITSSAVTLKESRKISERGKALTKIVGATGAATGVQVARIAQTVAEKPVTSGAVLFGFGKVSKGIKKVAGAKTAFGAELGALAGLGAVQAVTTPKERRLSVIAGTAGLVGGVAAVRVGVPKAQKFVLDKYGKTELIFESTPSTTITETVRARSSGRLKVGQVFRDQGFKGIPTGLAAEKPQFVLRSTKVRESVVVGRIIGGRRFVPFGRFKLFEQPIRGSTFTRVNDVLRGGYQVGRFRVNIVETPKFTTQTVRSLDTGKLISRTRTPTREPVNFQKELLGGASGKITELDAPGINVEKSFGIKALRFTGVTDAGRVKISGVGLFGRFSGTRAGLIRKPVTTQVIQELALGKGAPKITRQFKGRVETDAERIVLGGKDKLLPEQLILKTTGPRETSKGILRIDSKVTKTPGVLRSKTKTVITPKIRFKIIVEPQKKLPIIRLPKRAAKQRLSSEDKKILAQLTKASEAARAAAKQKAQLQQVAARKQAFARSKTGKALKKVRERIKQDVSAVSRSVLRDTTRRTQTKPVAAATTPSTIITASVAAASSQTAKAFLGQSQRQRQNQNIRQQQNILGKQNIKTRVGQGQKLGASQKLKQAQKLSQAQRLRLVQQQIGGGARPKRIRPFIEVPPGTPPPPPPPPPPPGINLKIPIIDLPGVGAGEFVKPSRRTKYRPDVFSLEHNIVANKKEVKALEKELTGLEARPLTRNML